MKRETRCAVRGARSLIIFCILICLFIFISPDSVPAQGAISGRFSKESPEQYFIKTEDGWTLSLYRYRPASIKPGTSPVILCHGFNFNSNMWDLDEKHSMARYLKSLGYDTWTVNLRGSGDSSKPAMSDIRSLTKLELTRIPRTLMRMPFNVNKFDWTIDDHIRKDLPAIIDFVKYRTGTRQVSWIGHSMGGMVMYGYLQTGSQKIVKNFVAIGSMISVEQPPSPSLALVAYQKPAANASLLINTTVAYQMRNVTMGAIKLPWEELFYNEDNMDGLTAMKMFRLTIDDTAPGVISQFADIIKSGDFMSANGRYDYTKNMDRITVPVLFVAGEEDRMGTVETITKAYGLISSKDKKIVIFSRKNGYSADYGHCDLILGRRSQDEVYPLIAGWLDKR